MTSAHSQLLLAAVGLFDLTRYFILFGMNTNMAPLTPRRF